MVNCEQVVKPPLTWAYIRKFPAEADLWSSPEFGNPAPGIKKPKGTPKGEHKRQVPKVEKMRDRLGEDDPTSGAFGYSLLSMLTHPKSLGLALQITHHGDSVSIRRGPQFDFLRMGLAYLNLLSETGLCLLYMVEGFARRNGEWIREAAPVVNEYGQWVTTEGASSRMSLQHRITAAVQSELTVSGD